MPEILKNRKSASSRASRFASVGDVPVRWAQARITQSNSCIYSSAFQYTRKVSTSSPDLDAELTQHIMAISEESLAKEWDNENDERWNRFLKD